MGSAGLWIRGAALAASLLLGGCGTAAFQSDVGAGPKPWTNLDFDDANDSFSFAIVSDLESGYRPGVFEVAAAQLGLMRPALVLTIGDQIEGGTEDEALLRKEWDVFDARLSAIHAPYFHIGGNHDLTNLAQRKVWQERYGPRYYAFVYKDVLFLALDTEDYSDAEMKEIYEQRDAYLKARQTNPAAAVKLPYASRLEAKVGEISPAQSAYFEKAIKDHPNVKWTFVLFHKPIYQREDGLGLKRIEAALKGRPYTVINGHLHKYSYGEKDGRDYIMLGTTGGERDFSGAPGAIDHFMWVTMTKEGPSIANLRLDRVLDKKAEIPAGGAKLCLSYGAPPCPAPAAR